MNALLCLRSTLATVLRACGLYHPLRDRRFAERSHRELADWVHRGRPLPPPAALKHALIRRLARLHRTATLVETGTFYGDTISAFRGDFHALHSIELAVETLRAYVAGQRPNAAFTVEDDIICIAPV